MRENLALDYTAQWIALGIVSMADIASDEREWLRGEDPHPEHYRWRAFSRFLAAQQPLSPTLAHELYRRRRNRRGSLDGRIDAGRHPAPPTLPQAIFSTPP